MLTTNSDYNITLLTTPGCQGCSIMLSNTVEAVSKSSKPIDFKHIVIGQDNIKDNKAFLVKHNIKDFPTLMLFKGDKLLYKYSGSMPIIVILRWIDVHFK